MENFFKHRHLLEAIKGQHGTHIGEGKTAPYYYHFGHYWTARAMKYLPEAARSQHRVKMSDQMMKDQFTDGEFWDCPMVKDKEVYGTAFGALTFYEVATELPPDKPKPGAPDEGKGKKAGK